MRFDKLREPRGCLKVLKLDSYVFENIIEQGHKSIKRIISSMLGFQLFHSADKILKEIEALNTIKRGQIKSLNYSGFDEVKYIN
jgi:transposase-like protein